MKTSRFKDVAKTRKKSRRKQGEPESLHTPTIDEWAEEISFGAESGDAPAYIDQLLPMDAGEGILIAGRTGVGKTAMAFQMAYDLASGSDFYNYNCVKTPVALFVLEGGERKYPGRIAKVKALYPRDTGELIRFTRIKSQAPKRAYAEVMGRLDQLPHEGVVILDGVSRMIEGNQSNSDDAKRFIQRLTTHLTDLGRVAVLTLQIVKPVTGKGRISPGDIYNVKSAVEILEWVTTSMMIEQRKRMVNDYVLHFDKHGIAALEDPTPIELVYSYDDSSFKYSFIKEFLEGLDDEAEKGG